MITNSKLRPLMVLGTTSGAGKSLMATAICKKLLRQGEVPVPFKGQNMSNNAWVDKKGGEMAYSQALQAWAAGLEPTCEMNPVLLKPKGNCTSEVIHLGKSVGTAKANSYYEEWFTPGWETIQQGLRCLIENYPKGRLVLEGAGSPVEINLKHRDLTNLKLARHLNANCILVADIERGGVFAQIIGTLSLMSNDERKLIKGLLINRFRGDLDLFNDGRTWLEKETGIPVLGIMPWVNEIFPPEDSLDLLERNNKKNNAEIEIAIIKLPSLSNFSDLDPLESEPTVQLRWVKPGDRLGQPDALIIPGSKQTINDLNKLLTSNLGEQIKDFAQAGGNIFGICGGMQMLGETLNDPFHMENSQIRNSTKEFSGLGLLPIHTIFKSNKSVLKRNAVSFWPKETTLEGFEMHYGTTLVIKGKEKELEQMMKDPNLGWIYKNKNEAIISGTYLHGIFNNGRWRRLWLNIIRKRKNLSKLPVDISNHTEKRDNLINSLTDIFDKHIDLMPILKA